MGVPLYLYNIIMYIVWDFFSQAVAAVSAAEGVEFCITLQLPSGYSDPFGFHVNNYYCYFIFFILLLQRLFFPIPNPPPPPPLPNKIYSPYIMFFHYTSETNCCANFLTIYFYDVCTYVYVYLCLPAVRVHTNKRVVRPSSPETHICIFYTLHMYIQVSAYCIPYTAVKCRHVL